MTFQIHIHTSLSFFILLVYHIIMNKYEIFC
nr:MAG TPA: hypothetical protein [Caudoviricetes sp.]